MFTLATRALGSYADSNLTVDSATDSDFSSEGVETGSRRSPSPLTRGRATVPRLSRFTAPVTNLAARTMAVTGATAALSPVAMAADHAAASFGAGHLALAFAAGSAVTLGLQSLRTRFAARPTGTMARTPVANLQAATHRVDSGFEARKQAALSRVLPSLEGVTIPKGAELVALPAGEFMMGDANSDYDREKPAHQVVLSAFYMMAKDVSHAFFQEFKPSHTSYEGFDGLNQPVVKVDHNDALDFADWMNEKHGVAGMKWRLPTEAEMEYAMRGKAQRATDAVAPDRVNVYASGHGKTLDVDAAGHDNNYGLFHIRGQVWKWCLDHFGNYSAEPVINPRGAAEGDTFVLRGGSYYSDGDDARLAYRNSCYPDDRSGDIGFRLVLAPEDS